VDEKEIPSMLELAGFFKQLMRENIAMWHVLKDLKEKQGVNWHPDYRSYLAMTTDSTDCVFAELEQAIAAQKDVLPPLERLSSLYKTSVGN
jgi:hypothetical protein